MFKNFYSKHVAVDIINRFNFSLSNIPSLKKLILILNSKNLEFLSLNSLVLRLICKKNINSIIKLKKSNILLKIKKGIPIGCIINLKNRFINLFFKLIIIEIIPFISLFNNNILCFSIKNLFLFKKLEKFVNKLNRLSNLNILFIFKTNKKKTIKYIVKNFKLKKQH